VQSGAYDALADRPMIDSAAIAKIERHFADAKAKGARGRRTDAEGALL
jgi:hypothetical protein